MTGVDDLEQAKEKKEIHIRKLLTLGDVRGSIMAFFCQSPNPTLTLSNRYPKPTITLTLTVTLAITKATYMCHVLVRLGCLFHDQLG